MSAAVHTVRDLRAVLEGRADDELVHAQVVAADGTAWTMRLNVGPLFMQPRGIVISLEHPQLTHLSHTGGGHAAPEPSWCAANGSQTCRIGPHGPKGELQCEWCGDAPPQEPPK